MRILMVRVAGKVSGAEIYNLYLAKGFEKYKDVELIYLTDNKEFKGRLIKVGVESNLIKTRVKEVGTKKDLLKSLFLLPLYTSSFIKTLKQLEKKGKFDLVCFQSMTEKIFLTPILKLMKYKIVWIEHGPLFKTQRTRLIKFLYKVSSIFVNKIITVSRDTQQDLILNKVKKDKVDTVYIGIDPSFPNLNIEKEKRKIGLDSKDFIIGFLGSVCEEKGIMEFIHVARRIIERNKKFRFLIIGDGDLLEWAKSSIKDVKDHFIFLGHVDDAKKYLAMFDIFFFPTKHEEGLSIAMLEAMSYGIPVVANDIGGNKELIKDKQNGFLFDLSNYNENKITDFLIRFGNNEKKRKIIGERARKNVEEKFNIYKNTEKFYRVFKNEMLK